MGSKNRSLRRKPNSWFTRRTAGLIEHNWPSNFWIEPDGTHVEGEYQAAKHEGYPWRQVILLNHPNPGRTKKLGRKWKLTKRELAAWEKRKVAVMEDLVWQKVQDHAVVRKELKATGNEPMTEFNFWHDNEWGVCVCSRCSQGSAKNLLGKVWMKVRESFTR